MTLRRKSRGAALPMRWIDQTCARVCVWVKSTAKITTLRNSPKGVPTDTITTARCVGASDDDDVCLYSAVMDLERIDAQLALDPQRLLPEHCLRRIQSGPAHALHCIAVDVTMTDEADGTIGDAIAKCSDVVRAEFCTPWRASVSLRDACDAFRRALCQAKRAHDALPLGVKSAILGVYPQPSPVLRAQVARACLEMAQVGAILAASA
jgi:hypothetical protein